MLKTMMQKLRALQVDTAPFDPRTLDDDVAMQTAWEPLVRGGTSFQTHRLKLIQPNRIEFRMTSGAKAFYGVFVLVGMGIVAVGVHCADSHPLLGAIIGLFGVGTFVGMGWLYVRDSGPNVFDVNRGAYWKGRRQKHDIGFDRIHALQLISEYIPGNADSKSYCSYELNLVLDDGQRINVVDHGNLTVLQADAQAIAQRIGKPVWDATAVVSRSGRSIDVAPPTD